MPYLRPTTANLRLHRGRAQKMVGLPESAAGSWAAIEDKAPFQLPLHSGASGHMQKPALLDTTYYFHLDGRSTLVGYRLACRMNATLFRGLNGSLFMLDPPITIGAL
jgi:hypothetical protein